MSEAHEAASPDPGALRRVMVIGNSGSGKSQFGRRLAEVLDLPLTDLDDEHWQTGWVEPPEEWWRERQRELVAEERWVLEGNYSSTIDIRGPRADLVVLFDLPRWLCAWRVIVRFFKIRFGRQIWRFPKRSLPPTYDRLAEAGVERLVVLRSTGDTRALDAALTSMSRPSEALRAHEEPLANAMAG